ncbi:hypothetical protein CIPAW_04G115600 [Carya illinoinensis]|uniref:Uncharacterized protein n=1 Tax=Carya illinoinensis TaxID=32201 RepID=A0A8T1QUI2_CARIL|nr:hypothetical protein CIPAW_04G115600 [Carya illinoinensis]
MKYCTAPAWRRRWPRYMSTHACMRAKFVRRKRRKRAQGSIDLHTRQTAISES